jgi:hypothetical protein
MSGRMRKLPVLLIAAPAAVAIWSGWIGLGQKCGFGLVHPLPGIWPSLKLDTSITLPVGVEAYGATALGAWLRESGVPESARQFAKRSAIGSLALGMLGQVAYHLLAAAHATRAPWLVVVLVSCMPVVTLGFATALTHKLHGGPDSEPYGPPADFRTDEFPADLPPEPAPVRPARPERRALPPAEIDRDTLVAELAADIVATTSAGERWRPDYRDLMTRTGFRRSWCEKAVRDARKAAARTDRTGVLV